LNDIEDLELEFGVEIENARDKKTIRKRTICASMRQAIPRRGRLPFVDVVIRYGY
jgi:hypothetical protein